MKPALPRLLLITDRKKTARGLPWAVESALSGVPLGAAGVILREKDLEGRPLLALANELRAVTHRHGALLIINSRVDVALACDADGVHLGGDAPSADDITSLWKDRLIGVSLHDNDPMPAIADYALISPVFPTASKPGASPLGLDGLRARNTVGKVFALGGINASNAKQCLGAGAFGVAVLGSVLAADDPAAEAQLLWKQIAQST